MKRTQARITYCVVGLLVVCAVSYVLLIKEERARPAASPETKVPDHVAEVAGTKVGKLDQVVVDEMDIVLAESVEGMEQRVYEERLKSARGFAAQGHVHELDWEEARSVLSAKDLPELYALLRDPACKDDWRYIAQLIGYLSDHGNETSVNALFDYFRRADDWSSARQDRVASFAMGMGKIMALEWIGMVGGETAEELLAELLEPGGAERLASAWLPETEFAYPGKQAHAIDSIRGRAATGLVYVESKDGAAEIERLYQEEYGRCVARGLPTTHFLNELVSALAVRDLISDIGIEGRFRLYGKHDFFEKLHPYIMKYLPEALQRRDVQDD
ncbi:MAG TPA: hypothetical protein HPP77_04585 [Candidatus Hydrogenedentes bacterium]|nr:hypothetical protein [Candidatus Hydrogenedentota bacterium]